MTRTWREMLKTVLAERKYDTESAVVSNIITAVQNKERWPANLGGYLDTTGLHTHNKNNNNNNGNNNNNNNQ